MCPQGPSRPGLCCSHLTFFSLLEPGFLCYLLSLLPPLPPRACSPFQPIPPPPPTSVQTACAVSPQLGLSVFSSDIDLSPQAQTLRGLSPWAPKPGLTGLLCFPDIGGGCRWERTALFTPLVAQGPTRVPVPPTRIFPSPAIGSSHTRVPVALVGEYRMREGPRRRPRVWAHKFRVHIPAASFDPEQVTSTDLSFLIWKMGLLTTTTTATQLCFEDSGHQVEGSGHTSFTIVGQALAISLLQ